VIGQVPNANVLQRALWIRCGQKLGTGFTIEVEHHQFLVTAKHVVDRHQDQPVEVFTDGLWRPLGGSPIPSDPEWVDVAVFAPSRVLTPALPTLFGNKGATVGQQLYILGFPFDPTEELSNLLHLPGLGPVPMVKGGHLAAFVKTAGAGHLSMLLDCYANEGFSGGPVVGFTGKSPGQVAIMGLVSHYVPEHKPVVAGDQKTALTAEHNPGILVTFDIGHAIDGIYAAGPTRGAEVSKS
jgi:hypothetical protein